MFVSGGTNDSIFQYTLSTPWDVSSAGAATSKSIASQDTTPRAIVFNDSGTKMFMNGGVNNKIFQYSLPTAWDITTLTYIGIVYLFTEYASNIVGMSVSDNGKRFYLSDYITSTIHQYDFVPTPYNLDVASYDDVFIDVGTEVAVPEGGCFDTSGTRMYVFGGASNAYQYVLTTAWDLTTASYDSKTFNFNSQVSNARDIAINDDGTKVYVLDNGTDEIYQYTLDTPYDISTADYSTPVSFDTSSQAGSCSGITFKPDGMKAYVIFDTNDDVFAYDLSGAWDLNTISYNSETVSVTTQATSARDMAFSSDGLKMFVICESTDNIYLYNLSTAWDVSTASYSDISLAIGTQDGNGNGIMFNADGTKMYMVGYSGGTNASVYQYSTGQVFSTTAPGNVYDSSYETAITNAVQIDTTYWTDINSLSITETLNNQSVFYAASVDDYATWNVCKLTDGTRPIVRNNGGTWEYNSNATYTATTWTSATVNDQYQAFRDAMGEAANQMDSTQAEAVGDADWIALGTTLDLARILYTDDSTATPYSDTISINYDGNVEDHGAIHGTDYSWIKLDNDTVQIKSLADLNLKVRIL